MSVIAIPRPLRERLGEEATDAFVEVIKELEIDSHKGLATKEDIARLEGEIKTSKWMLGVVVAGVASLILKSFLM